MFNEQYAKKHETSRSMALSSSYKSDSLMAFVIEGATTDVHPSNDHEEFQHKFHREFGVVSSDLERKSLISVDPFDGR